MKYTLATALFLGIVSTHQLSDPARSSEGLNQMVQSEKTENKVIQNAADQDFEQFDQNGKEILPENATKFMVKELVIPVAHQSVVQNKIQKVPQIEFDHSADIFGFNEVLKDAISLVKVDTLQEGKGETCSLHDWAAINYKTYKNGQLVQNSQLTKDAKKGYAKNHFFQVGHYEVSKCWDIAIQQMSPGQISHVSCPPSVDLNLGHNQQALEYELELVSCQQRLDGYNEIETFDPSGVEKGECFYLIPQGNQKMAVQVGGDAFAPETTGSYSVLIGQRNDTSAAQKWTYDATDKTIHPALHNDEGVVLAVQKEGNILVSRNMDLDEQHFTFDAKKIPGQVSWNLMKTNKVLDVSKDKFVRGPNILASVDNGSKNQSWKIEYCV